MDTELQESSVDVDLQAANIRAREGVEIARGRVVQTRRVISEKRQELQMLRERQRNAADKVMRAIHELMILDNVRNLQSLAPLYQVLSKTQDDLGPAEDAYDRLEIRLNHEEEQLEKEEMHFYTHNNIRLALPPDSEVRKSSIPPIKPYEADELDVQSLSLGNSQVREYLSKMFEAGNLKAQLHHLEDEQYELTEELAFRERYHLQLSEDKAALLFDFPKIHQELLDDLQRVEDDVYELRDRCLSQNLFAETDYVYEPYDALVDEIWGSVNDARDRSPLYAHYTPHEVDFTDKQDHVNTWLLEWMQESPIDIIHLKSFIYFEYPEDGPELVDDDWSVLALEFWGQDFAGEHANTEKRSTIDVVLGGTGSSLEIEDWGFGPEPIVTARSLSSQKGGQDVGIELAYVKRMQPGEGPLRRRKRGVHSRALSI